MYIADTNSKKEPAAVQLFTEEDISRILKVFSITKAANASKQNTGVTLGSSDSLAAGLKEDIAALKTNMECSYDQQKAHIDQLKLSYSKELAELKADLKADLKATINSSHAELKARIDSSQAAIKGEIAALTKLILSLKDGGKI